MNSTSSKLLLSKTTRNVCRHVLYILKQVLATGYKWSILVNASPHWVIIGIMLQRIALFSSNILKSINALIDALPMLFN